jgi:peptidoglycan/xylan/chitin deacetylase (PgdA/CDA1 family)
VAEWRFLGAPPKKSVALTFDDGYADNVRFALPVLAELGFGATVFVIVGRVGTDDIHRREWLASGLPVEEYRYLSWEELGTLHECGVEIGAHTMSHALLDEVPLAAQRYEIDESRRVIERGLGVQVQSFCYPAGRSTAETLQLIHELGFRQACITPWRAGLLRRGCWGTIPRVGIYRHDTMMSMRLKLGRVYPVVRRAKFWTGRRGAG